MNYLIAIGVSLVASALLTSYAEYKFNYNLVDLILEKIGYGVHKAEQEVKKL